MPARPRVPGASHQECNCRSSLFVLGETPRSKPDCILRSISYSCRHSTNAFAPTCTSESACSFESCKFLSTVMAHRSACHASWKDRSGVNVAQRCTGGKRSAGVVHVPTKEHVQGEFPLRVCFSAARLVQGDPRNSGPRPSDPDMTILTVIEP